jgi:hypothetical protein
MRVQSLNASVRLAEVAHGWNIDQLALASSLSSSTAGPPAGTWECAELGA